MKKTSAISSGSSPVKKSADVSRSEKVEGKDKQLRVFMLILARELIIRQHGYASRLRLRVVVTHPHTDSGADPERVCR